MCGDPYQAAQGADAVVIATAWPEFAVLEPSWLEAAMAGRVVLDAVGVLDPAAAEASGLEVITVGQGTPGTFQPVAGRVW